MAPAAPASSGSALDDVERLFSAARRGEVDATDALCRRMRPVLYRAAWSFLQDRDDADDVAQEALVRALTKRFLFVSRGSAKGFMIRIATNLAKTRLRDQQRRRQILHDNEPRAVQETLADAAAAPGDGLSAAEERARVEAVMSSLSERQAEVVRLRLLSEMSFAEVAAALGIREENARVTFSQAKARLRSRTFLFGPGRRGAVLWSGVGAAFALGLFLASSSSQTSDDALEQRPPATSFVPLDEETLSVLTGSDGYADYLQLEPGEEPLLDEDGSDLLLSDPASASALDDEELLALQEALEESLSL